MLDPVIRDRFGPYKDPLFDLCFISSYKNAVMGAGAFYTTSEKILVFFHGIKKTHSNTFVSVVTIKPF